MLETFENQMQIIEKSTSKLSNSITNLKDYNNNKSELSKINENIKNLLKEVTVLIKSENTTINKNNKINNNTIEFSEINNKCGFDWSGHDKQHYKLF